MGLLAQDQPGTAPFPGGPLLIPVKPKLRSVRAGSVMAAMALCLGPASGASAAPADDGEPMVQVAENGRPGLLSLTSSVFPLTIPALSPGESFSWQIGLHLTDQPAAGGSLEFIPHGALMQPEAGYVLTAQGCETQWTGQSGTGSQLGCTTGARALVTEVALEHGPTARIPVGNITVGTSPHILFTLTRSKGSAIAAPYTFALGFTVMGDDQMRDSNALPSTGAATTGLLAAAGALAGAGAIAMILGRKEGNT
jgi:LPXTG-motif cell wall-anchored protein